MSEEIKLAPCKFCKGAADITIDYVIWAHCESDKGNSVCWSGPDCETIEDAAKAWNDVML